MQIDVDHAYSHCKQIAVSHYENFPVGSLLIPASKRKYIYSIYAFARYADDIADSAVYSEAEKLSKLTDLDEELDRIESKDYESLDTGTRNIFIALSNTIDELRIPVREFRDLLKAFRQDSVKQRYDTFDELIKYSKYSANPIGHLVLYIFGYSPEKNNNIFEYSDKVCTALQLTNFWQDVSEDLKINRIYIPGSIMKENNYDEQMLSRKTENDDFRKLIKSLADKTKSIYEEGREITGCVRGRLKLELMLTISGGMEILDKIRKINYNVLSKRVTITKSDKLRIIGKLIWK